MHAIPYHSAGFGLSKQHRVSASQILAPAQRYPPRSYLTHGRHRSNQRNQRGRYTHRVRDLGVLRCGNTVQTNLMLRTLPRFKIASIQAPALAYIIRVQTHCILTTTTTLYNACVFTQHIHMENRTVVYFPFPNTVTSSPSDIFAHLLNMKCRPKGRVRGTATASSSQEKHRSITSSSMPPTPAPSAPPHSQG